MERLLEFIRRLLQKRETAGLLIGVVTLAVLLLPIPLFGLALALFSYLLGYELERITGRGFLRYVSLGGYLFSLINLYWGLLFASLAALGIGYLEVLKKGHYSHSVLQGFLLTFLTAVYGGLFVSTLFHLKELSFWIPLTLVLAIWAADSAAYYAGRYFGKSPFFSAISPKKTFEGFIGGFLAGTFVGTLFSALFGNGLNNPLLWGGVVIVSVFGDLFESFIKRSFGVKDSSNLLGSHGGLLDRFDALLFASLALSAFLN